APADRERAVLRNREAGDQPLVGRRVDKVLLGQRPLDVAARRDALEPERPRRTALIERRIGLTVGTRGDGPDLVQVLSAARVRRGLPLRRAAVGTKAQQHALAGLEVHALRGADVDADVARDRERSAAIDRKAVGVRRAREAAGPLLR